MRERRRVGMVFLLVTSVLALPLAAGAQGVGGPVTLQQLNVWRAEVGLAPLSGVPQADVPVLAQECGAGIAYSCALAQNIQTQAQAQAGAGMPPMPAVPLVPMPQAPAPTPPAPSPNAPMQGDEAGRAAENLGKAFEFSGNVSESLSEHQKRVDAAEDKANAGIRAQEEQTAHDYWLRQGELDEARKAREREEAALREREEADKLEEAEE